LVGVVKPSFSSCSERSTEIPNSTKRFINSPKTYFDLDSLTDT
jgi:hypothetical protein